MESTLSEDPSKNVSSGNIRDVHKDKGICNSIIHNDE